jgi:hypothetical protein
MDTPRFRETYAVSRWIEDTVNDLVYVGHIDPGGRWVIERYDLTNGVVTLSKGEEDFTTNWTNRAALSYAAYDTEF